jgi:Flagellar P-ring protein
MDRALHLLRLIAAADRRAPRALLAAVLLSVALGSPAAASSRIKDIADFEGVRDNLLVGYGLVVGLNGTGDSLRNSAFTAGSLEAMLERLGVATRGQDLKTKNVAAVMVTATLPAFARQGSRMDVAVSALGDAKSLEGGPSWSRRCTAPTARSTRSAKASSRSAASSLRATPRASPRACRPRPGSRPAGSSSARSSSSSTS